MQEMITSVYVRSTDGTTVTLADGVTTVGRIPLSLSVDSKNYQQGIEDGTITAINASVAELMIELSNTNGQPNTNQIPRLIGTLDYTQMTASGNYSISCTGKLNRNATRRMFIVSNSTGATFSAGYFWFSDSLVPNAGVGNDGNSAIGTGTMIAGQTIIFDVTSDRQFATLVDSVSLDGQAPATVPTQGSLQVWVMEEVR